jgi:hypothetical protein
VVWAQSRPATQQATTKLEQSRSAAQQRGATQLHCAAASYNGAQNLGRKMAKSLRQLWGHLLPSSTGSVPHCTIFGARGGFDCGGLLRSAIPIGSWPVGCLGFEGNNRWTGGLLQPFVPSPNTSPWWAISMGPKWWQDAIVFVFILAFFCSWRWVTTSVSSFSPC